MDGHRFRAFDEGARPREVLAVEVGPKSGSIDEGVPPITADLRPSDQGASATFVV